MNFPKLDVPVPEDAQPAPQWRIEDIPLFISLVEPVADRHGFLVSAYGSTLRRGRGRDLDLIFSQKRGGAIPAALLMELSELLGARTLKSEPSLFAELCALLQLPGGKMIDLQIRLSLQFRAATDWREQ